MKDDEIREHESRAPCGPPDLRPLVGGQPERGLEAECGAVVAVDFLPGPAHAWLGLRAGWEWCADATTCDGGHCKVAEAQVPLAQRVIRPGGVVS